LGRCTNAGRSCACRWCVPASCWRATAARWQRRPVTNAEFTNAHARALGVIEKLQAPQVTLKLMFGEKAEIVLGSTRLEPAATRASGFRFRFERVEDALADLLTPLRDGTFLRVWEQWIPQPVATLWPFFVDTQVKGPYRLWHHTHDFEPMGAGTLMRDTVRYRLHAGWLGTVAAGRKVGSYVERIFAFRAAKIDEIFGR